MSNDHELNRIISYIVMYNGGEHIGEFRGTGGVQEGYRRDTGGVQ